MHVKITLWHNEHVEELEDVDPSQGCPIYPALRPYPDVRSYAIMSSTGGAIGISSASSELMDATIQYINEKLASNDTSTNVEKCEVTNFEYEEINTLLLSHEDPFPIGPNEEPETQQFTFRTVFIGCVLGGVIAASKSVVSIRLIFLH